MEFSPRRWLLHGKLYRKRMLAVILAAAGWLAGSWLAAQATLPQYGRKPRADKGPRALGLIQLSPTGKKARIIPIAIMMDGKFYDAGAYKADPVPMALDFGIVYEGFRSGVSQGVFTITQPGQLNHVWIAEGTWLPAGSKALEKHKKYSPPVIADEDKGGPPVLHRRAEKTDSDNEDKDKDKDKDKDQQKAASAPAPPTAAPPANAPSAPDGAKAPTTAPENAKTPAPPETAKAPAPASASSASEEPIEDPNRPRLRRGKPDSSASRDVYPAFEALTVATPAAAAAGAAKPDAKAAKNSAAASPQFTFIPAISDAGGPDPRPYTYEMKPAEEASYRNQMLDLAATLVRGPANAATKEAAATPKKSSGAKPAAKSAGKLPTPAFDDVSLRIFDLSNSNEPVLVLSAKTHPAPVPAGAAGNVEEPQEITLIARTNLEGDLRKLFFSKTDSQHLDQTPRMELIDAVDADGDGRGELLFRRTFDDGSAYAIYRVSADRLWPLFEPTP
ncbi:MAG TPA: hypothetical protein VEH47_06985 [Candidatus Acidoferrales bacterium]|nr:hypothetical protein [Candidatus Acidoferrales bacterium]